jgi:hypothetical protein
MADICAQSFFFIVSNTVRPRPYWSAADVDRDAEKHSSSRPFGGCSNSLLSGVLRVVQRDGHNSWYSSSVEWWRCWSRLKTRRVVETSGRAKPAAVDWSGEKSELLLGGAQGGKRQTGGYWLTKRTTQRKEWETSLAEGPRSASTKKPRIACKVGRNVYVWRVGEFQRSDTLGEISARFN